MDTVVNYRRRIVAWCGKFCTRCLRSLAWDGKRGIKGFFPIYLSKVMYYKLANVEHLYVSVVGSFELPEMLVAMLVIQVIYAI